MDLVSQLSAHVDQEIGVVETVVPVVVGVMVVAADHHSVTEMMASDETTVLITHSGGFLSRTCLRDAAGKT